MQYHCSDGVQKWFFNHGDIDIVIHQPLVADLTSIKLMYAGLAKIEHP